MKDCMQYVQSSVYPEYMESYEVDDIGYEILDPLFMDIGKSCLIPKTLILFVGVVLINKWHEDKRQYYCQV